VLSEYEIAVFALGVCVVRRLNDMLVCARDVMISAFGFFHSEMMIQVMQFATVACYHSAQNLLSSQLLSKNLKIRIYKTIILRYGLDLSGSG
jgi:hypothetical protein